MIKIGR